MQTPHEKFMRRAFELAKLGTGNVSPNPLVGCVIVREGKVIGEGYHEKYGEAHAEVNAIRSVANHELLKEATAYVSLEPCSHFGKTPPCANLLIEKKLKKVIVSNLDPNPLVAGKGLEKLKNAGIEVETGVLEQEGWELNRRFFTVMTKSRPYIILKWAQTADGFVARSNYDSKWISNWLSRKLVHKWRAEEDAIMVGKNTALHDNPKLNVREWEGNNPLRIVIDNQLTLPKSHHLFADELSTICYNQLQTKKEESVEYIKIDKENYLPSLFAELNSQKVQSIFIEGGSGLLHSLIEQNLWDEMRVFTSTNSFGDGIPAPNLQGELVESRMVLEDELKVYRNLL
jgi:diaminohydroxyphosphoribosylaminopyrimidine deaminase/5-amino-6-(5-phosphoribosylamino)uracil reductase